MRCDRCVEDPLLGLPTAAKREVQLWAVGLTKREWVEEGAMLETEGRVHESFLYRSLLPFGCLLFPHLTSRAAACQSAGVVGMVA